MDMTTTITTAAPVPHGQDSPDATGPDITPTTTADRLAHARQRHAAAVTNADAARQRADLAERAHRKAIAHRQRLLDQAASGEAVITKDLTRAGIEVATARDAADLAASIARGAGSLAERAHIAALQAEADHLTAGYHESVASRISAAEEVDREWAALQAAILAFNATAVTVSLASNAARLFNSSVDAHAATNPTLRTIPPGERPNTVRPADLPMKAAKVSHVGDGFGQPVLITVPSLAAQQRGLFGLVAPPVSTDHPIPPRHPGAIANGLVPAGWKPSSPAEAEAAERYDAISRRGG